MVRYNTFVLSNLTTQVAYAERWLLCRQERTLNGGLCLIQLLKNVEIYAVQKKTGHRFLHSSGASPATCTRPTAMFTLPDCLYQFNAESCYLWH